MLRKIWFLINTFIIFAVAEIKHLFLTNNNQSL